jgi:hypothetical protein
VVDVATREESAVSGWTETQGSTGTGFMGPCMMVLTLRTTSATRSGRGRKFIGPIVSNQTSTDGTPVPGAVSALQACGTALVTASTGLTSAAIGVYSPTHELFRDVTATNVRDYFATLRSRRD